MDQIDETVVVETLSGYELAQVLIHRESVSNAFEFITYAQLQRINELWMSAHCDDIGQFS